jgi:hypothetical protein
MKGKLIWSVFWVLLMVFVIVATMVVIPPVNRLLFGEENPTLLGYIFVISSGIIITGLGVTLLILTAKAQVERRLKALLLLAEASFVGFPISVILHNAVSGLAHFEEPFFFIIATIICPIGLVAGAIGSIVLNIKRNRRPSPSQPGV